MFFIVYCCLGVSKYIVEKAELPILVTELGILIDFKSLKSRKASLAILVTVLGIVTEVAAVRYVLGVVVQPFA